MLPITLASFDRWKLETGRFRNDGTAHFTGPREGKHMAHLVEIGYLTPVEGYQARYQGTITDKGREALAYLDGKKAEEKLLWDAILATVEEIKASHPAFGGTSQGPGEYTHYEDGSIDASTLFSTGNQDGSNSEFLITATLNPAVQHKGEPAVTVKIDESLSHNDHFWGPGGPRDQDLPGRRVVVGHRHYVISPDDPNGFQGHGGHRFEIEFFDGRRVVTHNLWSQGVVPPKWRERFPDNAEFVQRRPDAFLPEV
jgi:hypothetical protein